VLPSKSELYQHRLSFVTNNVQCERPNSRYPTECDVPCLKLSACLRKYGCN